MEISLRPASKYLQIPTCKNLQSQMQRYHIILQEVRKVHVRCCEVFGRVFPLYGLRPLGRVYSCNILSPSLVPCVPHSTHKAQGSQSASTLFSSLVPSHQKARGAFLSLVTTGMLSCVCVCVCCREGKAHLKLGHRGCAADFAIGGSF